MTSFILNKEHSNPCDSVYYHFMKSCEALKTFNQHLAQYRLCVHVCMYMCVHVYACVYKCMYLCMYLF